MCVVVASSSAVRRFRSFCQYCAIRWIYPDACLPSDTWSADLFRENRVLFAAEVWHGWFWIQLGIGRLLLLAACYCTSLFDCAIILRVLRSHQFASPAKLRFVRLDKRSATGTAIFGWLSFVLSVNMLVSTSAACSFLKCLDARLLLQG